MPPKRHEIIAQKPNPQEPRPRERWLAVALTVPLLGMVAAFGLPPDTATEAIEQHLVEEAIALRLPAQPAPEAEVFARHERVRRGDTVSALLARMQASDPEVLEFMKADPVAKAVFQQLTPGKMVDTEADGDGELLTFRLRTADQAVLKVVKLGEEYRSYLEPLPLDRQLALKSGKIRSSLFAATDGAGIPDAIATQLTKVFSTQIDFHRDLQRGDEFAVVYEEFYDRADLVKVGKVLAAEFINRGESHRLVYFEADGGKGEYYDPDGMSQRKAFLRSPLEFSRVSSGFSQSRLHPIRGNWQAHKGVDYPAPGGTPVVATCDGTVEFLGTQNGYGNVIELKHHEQYATLYAHLSRFAAGLRKGDQVNQGDVIGYVGSTGWATGPHLHYEFKIAGVHKDPQGSAVPVARAVESSHKAKFEAASKPLIAQLDMLRTPALAANFE
jgi:murein DD-endopeptidase MepM/ murein hydrolase activator NlpD